MILNKVIRTNKDKTVEETPVEMVITEVGDIEILTIAPFAIIVSAPPIQNITATPEPTTFCNRPKVVEVAVAAVVVEVEVVVIIRIPLGNSLNHNGNKQPLCNIFHNNRNNNNSNPR